MDDCVRFLRAAVFVLAIALSSVVVWRESVAQSDGVNKIAVDHRQSVCMRTACRPRRTRPRDSPLPFNLYAAGFRGLPLACGQLFSLLP